VRPERTIAGARAPVRAARVRVLRGRPPHHGLLRQKLRREVRHRTSIQFALLRRRICISGVDASAARSSRSTTLHVASPAATGTTTTALCSRSPARSRSHPKCRARSHPFASLNRTPRSRLSVRIGSGGSCLADHSGEGRTRDHQGGQPKRLGAFVRGLTPHLSRRRSSRGCVCRPEGGMAPPVLRFLEVVVRQQAHRGRGNALGVAAVPNVQAGAAGSVGVRTTTSPHAHDANKAMELAGGVVVVDA
jgi:hypothetical protein